MMARMCSSCGRSLSAVARRDLDTCADCRGATTAAPAVATHLAPSTKPMGPASEPAPPVVDDTATANAAVARLVALGNGHAVAMPPAAPAGRDEESATVARIAAMANGADLPEAPSADDDGETVELLKRMRTYDDDARAARPSDRARAVSA